MFHWYFLTTLWEVWFRLYDGRNTEPPLEYVNTRQFVRDVEPLFAEGRAILLRVDGIERVTGARVVVDGRLDDLVYTDSSPAENASGTEVAISGLAGRVTVYVDDGTDVRSVGGRGAVVEDVEANRLTVVEVGDDE